MTVKPAQFSGFTVNAIESEENLKENGIVQVVQRSIRKQMKNNEFAFNDIIQ